MVTGGAGSPGWGHRQPLGGLPGLLYPQEAASFPEAGATTRPERARMPFLEPLAGHSVGLFPHHIPGSDRNVSSPCRAHIPTSRQALNPTLSSNLCGPSSPSSSLKHRHTRMKVPTATLTGTHVDVTEPDPQKSRQRHTEAQMPANLHVNAHTRACVYKHAEAHGNICTCDRTQPSTGANTGLALFQEPLLLPARAGVHGKPRSPNQTRSPHRGPELHAESGSAFLFEFIFFWQKGDTYFQEAEPGGFAEPARLRLGHILASDSFPVFSLHSSCFSGALRGTASVSHQSEQSRRQLHTKKNFF